VLLSVVVGSRNIVIVNVVMNAECGGSLIISQSFTNNYKCRFSLFVFNCWAVTCKYFYSMWQQISSGINFLKWLGKYNIIKYDLRLLKIISERENYALFSISVKEEIYIINH